MTKRTPATTPPRPSTSSTFARAVPPVASTSSRTIDARSLRDRVAVHLQAVRPVLERVRRLDRLARELAGLARRDEARAERIRERRAEDEPARLGTEDELRLARSRPVGELPDRLREVLRVGDQRHEVLEDDPLAREVRDVADAVAEVELVMPCAPRSRAGRGRAGGGRAPARPARAPRGPRARSCGARRCASAVPARRAARRARPAVRPR